MKDPDLLSEAAKKRISPDPVTRSEYMSDLARLRHSRLTPEARRLNALKMVEARRSKKSS